MSKLKDIQTILIEIEHEAPKQETVKAVATRNRKRWTTISKLIKEERAYLLQVHKARVEEKKKEPKKTEKTKSKQ